MIKKIFVVYLKRCGAGRRQTKSSGLLPLRHLYLLMVAYSALIVFISCASESRIKAPKVISDTDLDYPLSAQLKRIEGEVVLGVFVSKDGKAQEVRLLQSSDYEELDDAAIKFAEVTQFEPGMVDGEPIGTWTKLLLRYKLTEVAFDKDRWLFMVRRFYNNIEKESEGKKRDTLLKKLYAAYDGLFNYVESYDDPDINSTIREVLKDEVERKWRPFYAMHAAPFTVLDDFLARYPDSKLTERAKEDLIREIINIEYKIRMKSLKSSRAARKSIELIDMLETRLKELQSPLIQPDP